MHNIPCPIRALAQSGPERIALEHNNRQVTYLELDRMVDTALALMNSSSVASGDVVAVLSDNSIEYAVLFYAAMRSGFRFMPLNNRLGINDYKEQLELADCRWLVVQEKYAGTVANLECQQINIDQIDVFQKINGGESQPSIDLNAEAIIMFSSGGRRKARGVVLSWANLYYSALGIQERLRFDSHDSWLATLPFYHIGGISILFRSILGGFKAHIFEKFEPSLILHAIRSNEASYLSIVPTMLADLITADEGGVLKKAQGIIVGGDGIDQRLRHKIKKGNLPVMATYGMTETASMVTLSSISGFTDQPNSSGKLLPYRKLKINESGGISVSGKTVAVRYLGEDERLVDCEWFKTNDLGGIDGEGNLTVKGRSDDIIISGGENIDLNRIVGALIDLPAIRDAVAIGRDDSKWGQRPIAFIEISDKKISIDIIKEQLQAALPSIYIPAEIIIVDQLPQTGTGKYDIVALRRDYLR